MLLNLVIFLILFFIFLILIIEFLNIVFKKHAPLFSTDKKFINKILENLKIEKAKENDISSLIELYAQLDIDSKLTITILMMLYGLKNLINNEKNCFYGRIV